MDVEPVVTDKRYRRFLHRTGFVVVAVLGGFVYVIVDPPTMPTPPWSEGTPAKPPVAAEPAPPTLLPKNVPTPGTSGPAPQPRPTTAAPTTAAPTATPTVTKTRHGNPTHIPPGQAKKAKAS